MSLRLDVGKDSEDEVRQGHVRTIVDLMEMIIGSDTHPYLKDRFPHLIWQWTAFPTVISGA